jgi:hypothetical protein
VSTTLDKMKIAPASRERYYTSFREIQDLAGDELAGSAHVAKLLALDWAEMWDAWDISNATKNRARAAVSRSSLAS